MSIDRRSFLKLVSVTAGSKLIWLTPQQAFGQGADHKVLSPSEVETLEIISEGLVPGSKESGVSHFVDHHLSVPPEECLLMIRYLGVPAPYVDFYRACLSAAEGHAQTVHGKSVSNLSNDELSSMIDGIARGDISEWQGPPAAFFYFVLRSDGIDVTYGTEQAFEDLDFPMMAHITPPSDW